MTRVMPPGADWKNLNSPVGQNSLSAPLGPPGPVIGVFQKCQVVPMLGYSTIVPWPTRVKIIPRLVWPPMNENGGTPEFWSDEPMSCFSPQQVFANVGPDRVLPNER